MNATLILFPSFAMFALTAGCIFAMGYARTRAVARKEVKFSYYRTYDEGAEPESLRKLTRHVQNHFEAPVLFHVGVLVAFVTQSVNAATVTLAWLYVAARVVHSYIHLGSNNVNRRFAAFAASMMMLLGLWGAVLVGLLTR